MRVNTLFVAVLASTVSAQTPEGFEPATDNYLVASYGSSTITPGLNIPINETLSAPTVSAAPKTLTLMIDLDAPYPSNRSYSPLIHWITTSPSSANSTVPYAGPAPPDDSPAHRYVLLSYSFPETEYNGTFVMPKGFENVGKGNDVISRLAFDLEGFVSAAGLEGLISANWFLVAPANETAGGNSTSTPPPEQFESAAREILVPVSLLGAAAAGMIAMML